MKVWLRICVVVAAGCLITAGVAQADHINLPVKWSQVPDQNESDDLFSMHALAFPEDLVVHDDWECNSSQPVVALRWWGSYLEEEIQGEFSEGPRGARHVPFEVSWHPNVPAQGGDPSHPGDAFMFDYVNAQEEFAFFDGTGKAVYEYNAYLNVPWEQEPGVIYWLDVALDPFDDWNMFMQGLPPRWQIPPEQVPTWGWSKAAANWGDQAYQNQGHHWGPWVVPPDSLHHDRAFEIMVEGEVIPVASEWGLVIMVLLLLAGAKVYFNRRRAMQT